MDVFCFILSWLPSPPLLICFWDLARKACWKGPVCWCVKLKELLILKIHDTVPFDRVNIKRKVLENTHLSMKNSLNSGYVHTKSNFYSVESIKLDPEKMWGAPAIEMWISLICTSIRKIWNMWKFKSCKAVTRLLIHFSNIVTFYWTVKRLFRVFFFLLISSILVTH